MAVCLRQSASGNVVRRMFAERKMSSTQVMENGGDVGGNQPQSRFYIEHSRSVN
jgi:hypothetical protein